MEAPTVKPKRNYETYYKTYYENHKDVINKRRSTGRPRGRPRKVVAEGGYDSASSSDGSQGTSWVPSSKTESV
jgi:hypothetical protein